MDGRRKGKGVKEGIGEGGVRKIQSKGGMCGKKKKERVIGEKRAARKG